MYFFCSQVDGRITGGEGLISRGGYNQNFTIYDYATPNMLIEQFSFFSPTI